jgi:hypothetical protein
MRAILIIGLVLLGVDMQNGHTAHDLTINEDTYVFYQTNIWSIVIICVLSYAVFNKKKEKETK